MPIDTQKYIAQSFKIRTHKTLLEKGGIIFRVANDVVFHRKKWKKTTSPQSLIMKQ